MSVGPGQERERLRRETHLRVLANREEYRGTTKSAIAQYQEKPKPKNAKAKAKSSSETKINRPISRTLSVKTAANKPLLKEE